MRSYLIEAAADGESMRTWNRGKSLFVLAIASFMLSGCAAIPDIVHQPQIHNPFPQFHKVAVLPFYNQSDNPHLNPEEVALAYYNELQQIPGFEVMPVGTAKKLMEALRFEPRGASDFQKLAQLLGVDAVVVGSVTEFSPYYPPRMGLAVNWYSANPGFHAIPPGYGLPWGTAEEEYIPSSLVFESEFALAREQLKTQTPEVPAEFQAALPFAPGKSPQQTAPQGEPEKLPPPNPGSSRRPGMQVSAQQPTDASKPIGTSVKPEDPPPSMHAPAAIPPVASKIPKEPNLPPDWPDPRGFVPPAPSAQKPEFKPHLAPVITHTKLYDGNNADFTEALANYYYFRDDERFGGWQSYLQRSPDFIRFCCYQHIAETLTARGGAGETRVVWRWPIGRYER